MYYLFIPKILLFLSDFKLLQQKFMHFQIPKKYISIFYFFLYQIKILIEYFNLVYKKQKNK